MKKYLIAIAIMLAIGINADAASQKHRHSQQAAELVDSAQKANEAIEAFSDTTSAANADQQDEYVEYQTDLTKEEAQAVKELLDGVGGMFTPWALVSIVAIVILFLIAPLLIILVIFYFVNKNRREKYKLAQMAIQNGQPIPNEILDKAQNPVVNDDYEKGLRQMFVGVGLAIFLGIVIGKLGIGIGALVFFVGLGKWYVAREARNNNPGNNNNINNGLNQL